MKTWNKSAKLMLIAVACLLAVSPAVMAAAKGGLTVKGNGAGTVALPPGGGQYISPADIHAWLASGVQLTRAAGRRGGGGGRGEAVVGRGHGGGVARA